MNQAAGMDSLRKSQAEWLMECLKCNAMSRYGRDYRFEEISSIKMYQEYVPMVDYETIEPSIKRIAAGEADVLFQGVPAAFEVTGGSTSGGKLIPYSEKSFKDFQSAILPWLYDISQRYGISGKAAYWSISPALRRATTTDGGIKIGVSDAEYLGDIASGTFNDSPVVPSWVGELYDVDKWQLATLYWLVQCRELELISVWSPTYLLMLMEVLEERSDELLALFTKGGMIDEHVLYSDGNACERLQNYLMNKESATLWPQIKLISCWQDGSSRPFFERLKHRFPHASFQPKGLISTEGVVTMPNADGLPLLSPASGFYEFVDADGNNHLAYELISGKIYEIILTTSGGLYRYRTGDMLQCEGYENALPILRFVGRKGIVSDMVGEKLNEVFVRNALQSIGGFSMLIPDKRIDPHYILLSDLANTPDKTIEVETKLMENPQYAYARKIGQLGSLEPLIIKDAMLLYIEYKTNTGSRVGDIKIPSLNSDDEWLRIIRGNIK